MVGDSNGDSDAAEQKPEWKNTERKRGILTEGDRKYLLGEKSLSGQSERNARYRIRQRFIHSLLDLGFIYELPQKDLEKIFQDERLSNEEIRGSAAAAAVLLSNNQCADGINELELDIEEIIEKAVRSILKPDLEIEDSSDRVPLKEYQASVSVEIEENTIDVGDLPIGAKKVKDYTWQEEELRDFIENAISMQLSEESSE